MNWQNLIRELQASMTQSQIAEACGTGQSHISALARGARLSPSWELGDRLIALHRRTVRPAGADDVPAIADAA